MRVCACARGNVWGCAGVHVCACARVRVCFWACARAVHARANLHTHIYKHAYTRPWLQLCKLYTKWVHLLPPAHCPHATAPSNQCHAAEMAFQKRNSARATVMRTQNDGDADVILRLSRAGRDGITNSSSKGCAPSEASSAHTNLRISMSPGPPPAPPTPLPASPPPPPVPNLLLLRMPLTAERRGRAVS